MSKPSLATLRAPANGQVYSLRKQLSKQAVVQAFAAAHARAEGRVIVNVQREARSSDGGNYLASLTSFPLTGPPAFFPESDLEEKTFGFLLLIEVEVDEKWYLGIFKHGVASLADWVEENCVALPRAKLARAFSANATIGKLSVRRMTSSTHELRRASYEAWDLQTSLPMIAAGRNAISVVRFNGRNGSFSITPSTSRVQRGGGRCIVDDLAALVALVAESIAVNTRNPFLETFAQAIPLDELPSGVKPNSILFDWSEILENDDLELCRANGGRAVKKSILLRLLGETIPVLDNGVGWQFAYNPLKSLGRFGQTASKYSVNQLLGNFLFIRDTRMPGVSPLRLTKWVRDNDAYAITFTSPEYFFCNGGLYLRAMFIREVHLVRMCLQPEAVLAGATSEKGEPNRTDTTFPAASIFNMVETTLYARRDWLCCSDLGDEWADYLCIRHGKLLFIHCKHGSINKGASCFHEVVGQGLKNLGRVRSIPGEFARKISNSWGRHYWSGTRIRRIRDSGRRGAAFSQALEDLLADPDSGREVHLVVSMLSLANFDALAGENPRQPSFLQLIWLLSGFINSCREFGAKPVIVCQP